MPVEEEYGRYRYERHIEEQHQGSEVFVSWHRSEVIKRFIYK